jgi:methionyl-tRNA synthetase
MYTMVVADVLKRWQELKGRKAVLLTGTDEHGMKIQQAAARNRVEPKQFCDGGAEVFRDLAQSMNMSYEIFIRTTDTQHKEAVEYAWHMLQQRGFIYEKKHEGWYSVSDETFYPASQVGPAIDPMTGRKMTVSIETGKEVEWTSERNYHFRLSAFREKLLEFYASNPDYIQPKTRLAEVVSQVEAGLEDLSISRPRERLSWGVPVPTDATQTIYVWLDALLSYASAVGYPFTPGAEHQGGWPADVQIIGKDIVRFHCIYWPAMLMALDLPLHKKILAHAHWTLGRQKMAKSTGNVVSPFFALERFGVDVMRWYLVHEGGIAQDADYDNAFIIAKYKKHLQNGLGNLLSRIMKNKRWDVARAVKCYAHPNHEGDEKPTIYHDAGHDGARDYGRTRVLPRQVEEKMRQLLPNKALQLIMQSVSTSNGFLQHREPWNMYKTIADASSGQLPAADDADAWKDVDAVIYLVAENLRIVAIMLQAFMPDAARQQLDLLGVKEDRRGWEWCRMGTDDDYGSPLVRDGEVDPAKAKLFPALWSESSG